MLIDVAEPKDVLAMRISVLPALVTLAPEAKATAALIDDLSKVDSAAARSAVTQAQRRLDQRRLAAQQTTPPAAQGAPAGGRAGGAGTGGGRGNTPARVARPDAEYRALVEKWIVPDYNGAPKPRAIWETPKGLIELELYPGDAPFGVEHFFRVVQSGDIVGTEFTRLVPNFVAQQQAIRNASTLRDEVNRHGLTRGNLAWASAGLDTGRPGYTLNHTPQPHNEGDFTSLGRVVAGMDVVDRLEIGDKVTSAKIK